MRTAAPAGDDGASTSGTCGAPPQPSTQRKRRRTAEAL
jgi:hypothetical protein